MAASVVVNKVPYDHYSLEVDLGIVGAAPIGIIKGVEEIEYTVTINREPIRGSSRLPVVMTEGDAEFSASITLLRSWYDLIVAKAKELKIPLASLEMTFAINYAHKGELLHTDTLTGVRIGEIGNSHKRGPDPLMTSVPLALLNIYFDGIDVFGNTL